jgi:muramoyltetrapeptide carboxypeptidase
VIRPPRLAPGAVVRVVAPSGPVPREAFLAGAAVLSARYDLRYDDGVFTRDGYLAGSDERRLEELLRALDDPGTQAIVMARGGYGLLRILPFLARALPSLLAARPRPLVGFSDGTALLAAATHVSVASIHGPVVTQLGNLGSEDQQALFARLETPGPAVLLAGMEELIPGRVQGPLLGGNLEVFTRLVGTPFLPDLSGAILFIEDLGERPYRVDRMLTHLDLAGLFDAVSAVVVGDFSSCREPEATRADSPTAEAVLVERLGRLPIPVVIGGAFGHGTRNRALPYGTLCELDTRTGTLTALEGAVS